MASRNRRDFFGEALRERLARSPATVARLEKAAASASAESTAEQRVAG